MRRLAAVLIFIIALNAIPSKAPTVVAKSDTEKLKVTMAASAVLLQRAIDTSRQEELKSFKSGITTNGFDYELTMQSYGNQTDPYANADFNELLVAYATLKEKGLADRALYNLPFIRINTTPTEIEITDPVRIDTYEEIEEGVYQKGQSKYIDEKTVVPVYTDNGDGTYTITEDTIEISPPKKTVKYEEVEIVGLSADAIFDYFGYGRDDNLKAEYEKKLAQVEYVVSGRGLAQMVSFRLPEEIEFSEAIEQYLEELRISEDIDKERRSVITIALSLLGKVPYEWGGKASHSGYDFNWWTFDGYGRQKGLDCSGFVEWCFLTAAFIPKPSILHSTQEILKNLQTIGYEDLMPGDIGLLNNGSSTNHTGIYLGNGYWIHCSSGAGTVIVAQTDMFTIFKRMPTDEFEGEEREAFLESYETPVVNIPQLIYKEALAEADTSASIEPQIPQETQIEESNEEEWEEEEEVMAPADTPEDEEDDEDEEAEPVEEQPALRQIEPGLFSEEDVYLLAQLIYHEAHTEGLNGWIAVAEVVKNRILSSDFPNTMREVIFQPKQFQGASVITRITPTNEEIEIAKKVLAGQIMVLANENVLFFRNAGGSKADWGAYKWFTEINHHEFYLGKKES